MTTEFMEKVEELLDRFNVKEPPVPVDTIARGLGAELKYVPFDGDVSGMLYRDGASTIIAINSLQPVNRQRFTIAHEIGHLLFHEGRKAVYVDTGYVNFRGHGDQDGDEREANQFASLLLMPERFIIPDLAEAQFDIESDERVESLRKRYKVSSQAMSIRLAKLGVG
jgi:Zn-dependent peptidase ImmA (M78 family)